MTIEEAQKQLEKRYPNLTVVRGVDYDKEHYVFSAPTSDEELDPFYGVDKRTGEITHFSPEDDLEHFLDVWDEGEEADDTPEYTDEDTQDDDKVIASGKAFSDQFFGQTQ